MAIALVSQARLSSGTATGTTATVTFAPTAGNKIVAVVGQGATPRTVTPSTTGASTTWTKAASIANGTVGQTDIWYADAIPSGITAVVITFGAAVKNTVDLYELSGAATGAAQTNTATGSASPGSVALPLADATTDFLIACVCTDGTGTKATTFGTVAGWTQDTQQTAAKTAQGAPAHRVGSGTTDTYNPTLANNIVWSAAIASFSVPSAGVTVALTGVSSATAVGTAAPDTSVSSVGVFSTATVGTLTPSTSIGLTGVGGTGSVGTVTASVSSGVTVALTGVTATGGVGALSPSTSATITSNAGIGAVGAFAPDTAIGLAGVSSSGAVGTVTASIGGNVTVALTGVSAATSVGTVAPDTTAALLTVNGTGAVGTIIDGTAAPSAITGGYAGANIAQFYKTPLNKTKTKTPKKKAEPEAVQPEAVSLAIPEPPPAINDDDEVAMLLWLLN